MQPPTMDCKINLNHSIIRLFLPPIEHFLGMNCDTLQTDSMANGTNSLPNGTSTPMFWAMNKKGKGEKT